jgi:basic amino acid/polyamine antiporter, APA family
MAETPRLERRLGVDAATALVVGEVVGVGIFLTPAGMLRGLGAPFWVLVVWLAVGTACLCGALCYGEMAARYPEAGGGYIYLREAWGPGLAFLYGWQSLLVMDPGLTAALAAGLARYAAHLAPLSRGQGKALGILAILVLAAVNAVGARIGVGVLKALTVLKVGLLALIVVWGFASGRGDFAHFTPFVTQRTGSAPLLAGLAGGVVSAFFSFGGFWDVAKLSGEVKDPNRTLPRALGLGVALVTLIYVLTSAVFIYLVPIESTDSGDAFAARAGEALFGPAAGRVFAAVVIVAVLGCMAAVLMAAPRVYYAMARDGVFPRSVGDLHPRTKTPVRAIALQALLASLLLTLGSFEQIIGYFVFVAIAFVGLTTLGLYRLPRPAVGEYRVPGYPWTPIAFLGLLAVLLLLLVAGSPKEAALGSLVVLLGAPVYKFGLAPRRTESPAPSSSGA